MKRVFLYILVFVIILGAGIGLGVYIRNETLNPKATLPTVFSRILSFLINRGEEIEDDLLYHDVNIADFIVNGSTKTKVAVIGKVESITHEPDGDYHIIVKNEAGLPLVTEFIPEIMTLTLPKVGDNVKIWGLVRFDAPHNWWELHPVIGWEKL